ncbi:MULTISPECIES: DUF6029 family protein [Flavobacterium]|uniref:DUF6029 family protein n=1 Tax=Flavobacterium jumunjinense TaxID=998845 RepID=A0ABV5GS53_9FLAO|nr:MULTISPECIES: DUF6029 family protein [Flavobacterium]
MKKITILSFVFFSIISFSQEDKEKIKGNFFGGFESNSQWYTNDKDRGINHPEDPFRSNNYLNANYNYGKWTAGVQGEGYLPNALLNYNPKYEKANVATYYLNYRSSKINATAGYFYEQFGSGLLLRSWEDRSLGINNALRGGKIKYTPTDNLSFTALYGRQRTGFDIANGDVFGFNSEINLFRMLKIESSDLSLGFSYVGRKETTTIINPNFNELTNGFAGRLNFSKNSFYFSAEYNFKTEDGILYDSKTVYNDFVKPGSALLLNGGYSKKGFGLDVTLRRLENMSFYSEREPEVFSPEKTSIYYNDRLMNFVPSLTKQHHFNLANIYVYQAQARVSLDFDNGIAKAGEIGGQIDIYYDFPKETALGGKYGTKISANFSNWNNLKGDYNLFPPEYKTDFLGAGEKYFSDFNLEINKKFSKKFSSTFAFINQYYNNRLITGAANTVIKANILAAEFDYNLSKGRAAKLAIEHMWADNDRKNWIAMLFEYNINTRFSVFASDMYNYGYDKDANLIDHETDPFDIHFYNFGGAYKKGSTRFAINYGRQRGGLVCAGGVCRFVPPSTGLGMSITTSFN